MTVVSVQATAVLDLVAVSRYDDAISLLGREWPGVAVEPRDSSPDALLSVGVLNAHLGWAQQSPQALEVAKNCLSRASRLLKGPDRDLCEIQLAITYWRAGDDEESLIQLSGLLERPLTESNRFRALLAYAVVLGSSGRHREESDYLARARSLLDYTTVPFRGLFHAEEAFNLRRLGGDNFDKAVTALTSALIYFEQCGAEGWEADARNNLSGIFKDIGAFEEAHCQVEKAIAIGARLGTKGRLAQCHDQQAQIFLAQGLPVRAAQCAQDAVHLCAGATAGWAIECRTTFAVALARIGDPRAVEEFSTAIQIAKRQENKTWETKAALMALEELDLHSSLMLMLEWFSLADRSDDRKRVNAVRRKLAQELAALADYEDVKIALEEHKGNITHAAKSLGYSHHTGLLAYLKHHPELRLKKEYRRAKK